jgi:hypothetical protein
MIVTILLEWLAGIAVVLFSAIGALLTRRVAIRRRGGTFDCSLRLTLGLAQAAVHYGGHVPAVDADPGGPADPARPGLPPALRGTRVPFSAYGVRAGRGWAYGIAKYRQDRVDWFRIFSYSYRPAVVLLRRELEVVGRRDAEGHEETALFPGWTIVECGFGAGIVELALSPDALTGFLSWLEAAPPGQNVGRVP